MKPNIAVQRRAEAVTQAIQTIERRVNELGVSEPIVAPYGIGRRPDHRAAAGRDRRRAREEHHRQTGAARDQAGRGRAGARSGVAAAGRRRAGAAGHGSRAGRRRRSRATRRGCTTSCARSRRSPAATCATRGRRSTSSTCRPSSFTLNSEGVAQVQPRDAANVGRQLAIVLDNGAVGAAHRERDRAGRSADHRHVHAAGSAGPGARPAVRRAAGVADLSRAARGRSVARRRTRSAPASWRRSSGSASSRSSC